MSLFYIIFGFVCGVIAAYNWYLAKLSDVQEKWMTQLKRDVEWHEKNIDWLKNAVEIQSAIATSYNEFYKAVMATRK